MIDAIAMQAELNTLSERGALLEARATHLRELLKETTTEIIQVAQRGIKLEAELEEKKARGRRGV